MLHKHVHNMKMVVKEKKCHFDDFQIEFLFPNPPIKKEYIPLEARVICKKFHSQMGNFMH